MPPAGGAERGCAAPSPAGSGPQQTPPGATPRSHATARSALASRFVCPAGRAPGSRRGWSTARCEGSDPSDGQPSATLGSPTLEHLATARGLHTLPEAVSLLPPALVRLKRPLHKSFPPRPSSRRSVGTAVGQVNLPILLRRPFALCQRPQ